MKGEGVAKQARMELAFSLAIKAIAETAGAWRKEGENPFMSRGLDGDRVRFALGLLETVNTIMSEAIE